MRSLLAGLLVSSLLVAAGCGDDDESSGSEESAVPTADEIQSCLAAADLKVDLEPGQYLINGGEAKGGTTITFHPSEEDATREAQAAQDVTGGTVEQNGNIVVVTQGGPESEPVLDCVA